MKKSLMKTNPLLKIASNSLIVLPTPVNISIWWNMGSMLGMCLMMQLVTGLLLSMHYCPNVNFAFESIIHIMKNVNHGWAIRNAHVNGASLFFICMYMHIGRGIYYHSFKLFYTWMIGVIILMMSMGAAFMGYILPWGQMSYWGATVITNLVSAIPFLGNMMVKWLWGGFSISNPTLNRFYSLHFVMPFIILLMVGIHLMFLHQSGSTNPTGTNSDMYKIPFHPYFVFKDILGFIFILMIMLILNTQYPYMLSDPDNFIQANPMVTPIHIQPEWYFLFAYAILRSIPSKLGGVIALSMSLLILLTLPLNYSSKFNSNTFYPLTQQLFWVLSMAMAMLTWLGAQPIEIPFLTLSQLYSILYFSYFVTFNWMNNLADKISQ